ncbi:MAG TPA: hypothetical protein VGQ12_07520 [Candidatus Angelobacter sp.]|jgi:hypothetical protein|nr:hypothetical protein [Candidatus Angelobacter sp.]
MSQTEASDSSITDLFTYHKPDEVQQAQYTRVNAAAAVLYEAIMNSCPPCADRSHALRLVRDAKQWANTAIALKGRI